MEAVVAVPPPPPPPRCSPSHPHRSSHPRAFRCAPPPPRGDATIVPTAVAAVVVGTSTNESFGFLHFLG